MDPVEQYIESRLQERIAAGNLRTLKTERAQVDFFSNDYLGLATNNILQVHKEVTGSTGSRLLSGNSKDIELLEERIAKFHNAETALLFNSGYDANTGLISCIANRHCTILYDELCHASIIDGVKLSMTARQYKFAHNDVAELKKKLEQYAANGPVIVVVESVYSMDGDIAPLKEIAKLTEEYKASLIVDEAHATGVFGKQGRGIVCEMGLEEKVFAKVHTFGKALGCHGAVVLGSGQLRQYLVNFARSFIYTTALPPQSVAVIDEAYSYLSASEFSNEALHELIGYFREKIRTSGSDGWKDSVSPIQALILGSNEKAKSAASALQKAGLQVNAILSPTVSLGMERLRVCLHAFNSKREVDVLFEILGGL